MDIASSIAAATSALQIIKEIRAINTEFDKAELKAKLADVMSQMADAKMGLIEAEERLHAMDIELSRMQEAIIKRDNETIEVRGYQYRKNASGKPMGSPYCPICMDEGRFVLTTHVTEPGRPTKCPKCKSNFGNVTKYAE